MKTEKLLDINWVELLLAAARSPLGICALAILAISAVAIFLFRQSPPKVRLSAFGLLTVGIIGLALATLLEKQKTEAKPEVLSVKGTPIPDVPENLRTPLSSETPIVVHRLSETDLTTLDYTNTDHNPSEVFSRHTFTLRKSSASQNKFYHAASTSSEVPPQLKSDTHNFTVEQRGFSKDGKVKEYLFIFDVSKDPVGEEFDLRFAVKFTGAFDRPDQLWAGILVVQPTDMATFRILFPPNHPATSVNFYVKETATEEKIDLLGETLRVHKESVREGAALSKITWEIPRPKQDQSYCIGWTW